MNLVVNWSHFLFVSNWGGEGSLGCGIGYGYLHRIPFRPKSSSETEPLMNEGPPQSGDLGQPSSQTQYLEKKSYQLQPQPQPASAPVCSHSYSSAVETSKPPVVVYDHKHQQEVYNANIVDTSPLSTPATTATALSSMTSTLANISLGDQSPRHNYQADRSSTQSQSTSVTNILNHNYPISSTMASTGSASYLPQSSSAYVPSYDYTQPNYSMGLTSSGTTGLPAYGQSFTTPLSLPGMPPLTVSATLPTMPSVTSQSDAFGLPYHSTYPSQAFTAPNLATNDSSGYRMDSGQPYQPHL